MAEQHDPIDVRTLTEVHRLLASSDFATAGDLLDRSGGAVMVETVALPRWPEQAVSSSAAPLPRRR